MKVGRGDGDFHCRNDETTIIFRHNAEIPAQMDDTDSRLIAALREDARAPTAALARRLGLSRTTVQSRLERLERSGAIAGYTVRLSDAYERGQIHAYVMITVSHKQASAVTA